MYVRIFGNVVVWGCTESGNLKLLYLRRLENWNDACMNSSQQLSESWIRTQVDPHASLDVYHFNPSHV